MGVKQDIQEQKTAWINSFIDAGFALMPLVPGTKQPDKAVGWPEYTPNPLDDAANYPHGYGVILKHNHCVIDIDPKHEKYTAEDGTTSLERLNKDLGADIVNDFGAMVVITREYPEGHKGYHLYFSLPEGVRVKPNCDQYPGIQALSYGHFVVGPGSIHPDTKKPYLRVSGEPDFLPEVPALIQEYWELNATIRPKGEDYVYENVATMDNFRKYLCHDAPVAIQGKNGDETTLKVAMVGKDMGLTQRTTTDMMIHHYNPRCIPQWSHKELAKKVANAYQYGKEAIGSKSPGVFTPITQDQWETDRKEGQKQARIVFDVKKDRLGNDILESTLRNVKNKFLMPNYGVYENELNGLIRRNMFTGEIEFTRPAPWHAEYEKQITWTDLDTTSLRAYWSEQYWNPKKDDIQDGLVSYARMCGYHPILDYLNSLKWDGKPGIDTILMDHFTDVEDSPYTREVCRLLMLGSVARVLDPGIKFDTVIILEGAQGTQKGEFFKTMAGKRYHCDISLDAAREKDTTMKMNRAWWCELSEFGRTAKSDIDYAKSFITREYDVYREPYGRVMGTYPRKCILVGSINPTDAYFRDPTGNRRYLPVYCGELDAEKLKRNRDQLYAEAVYRFRKGEPIYTVDKEVLKLTKLEQSKRMQLDAWTDVIQEWIDMEHRSGRVHEYIATNTISSQILGLNRSRIDSHIASRINVSMMQLGWERARFTQYGVQVRGFRNPRHESLINTLLLDL